MKFFLPYDQRKPDPEPAKVDIKRVLLIGTFVWGIAIIVLSALYQPLADAGLLWWLHTSIVGFGLGIFGFLVVRT